MSNEVIIVRSGGFGPSDWIAVVTLVATLAGTIAALIWTDRQRRRSAAEGRRRDVAQVMGSIEVLLLEADPFRWHVSGHDIGQRLVSLRERWEATRAPLATAAIVYHSEDVRERAKELDKALQHTVTSTISWVVTRVPVEGPPWTRANAMEVFAEARKQSAQLADLLRGERL